MSELDEDEFDKLLQDALAEADDAADTEKPETGNIPAPVLDELGGSASQDDIDALFSAVNEESVSLDGTGDGNDPLAATQAVGESGENDLDALFSGVGEAGVAPDSDPGVPGQATEPEINLNGMANQDDIDALFSALGDDVEPESPVDGAPDTELDFGPGPEPEPAFEPQAEPESAPDTSKADQERDHNTRQIESELAEAEAQADLEATQADSDFNAFLSSIAGEDDADDADADDSDGDEPDPLDSSSTTVVGDVDMDELLRQVAEAAPPLPHSTFPQPMSGKDTAVLSSDVSTALASALPPEPEPEPKAPAASAAPVAAAVPPAPVSAVPDSAAVPASARREYSVLYGAGEVDTVAHQINALLGSMSEKAHSYMQAWIAADSEAKELRARALEEERRRVSLEGEKTALARQLDELRIRLGELEGSKVAAEESRRTLDTSYQAKIRELESRVELLSTEAETLKEELTRCRNQATGVDIESRRARFEAERLKNEVESERMERIRIQRALENREKEMQALQAQSSGQASSLFIDELHRLVRRLESELDNRSAGAHDALKQVDRLEVTDSMVPVVANLRASLLQALGQDSDADDAIRSLGREAAGIKGPAAVAPEKAEMVSFETALSTYNLVGAVDVAGALLREAGATPSSLMKRIYQCQALRRPEVTDRLPDLARLLEGLRTVQEANDRSRGSESGESEVFYVHMFDFLHNLVKLKLINRMSGDMWRIFLDLRGRFSFVTSDKQWAEYRDTTLGNNGRQ